MRFDYSNVNLKSLYHLDIIKKCSEKFSLPKQILIGILGLFLNEFNEDEVDILFNQILKLAKIDLSKKQLIKNIYVLYASKKEN